MKYKKEYLGIGIKCYSFVIGNIWLHWHFGGFCDGIEIKPKLRLRKLSIGNFNIPIKCFDF
jgi:hypothetical protein